MKALQDAANVKDAEEAELISRRQQKTKQDEESTRQARNDLEEKIKKKAAQDKLENQRMREKQFNLNKTQQRAEQEKATQQQPKQEEQRLAKVSVDVKNALQAKHAQDLQKQKTLEIAGQKTV